MVGFILLIIVFMNYMSVARAADVFNGKKIYFTYCESCHGPNGQGQMTGVPNFTRGQTLMRSDLAIFESVRSGKNAMPAYWGVLDEQEILDVIAYIRTLY
jgi:cytochrome c6